MQTGCPTDARHPLVLHRPASASTPLAPSATLTSTPQPRPLLASGVAFTHAYCSANLHAQRASFLTGKYPSTIHFNTNGNSWFPSVRG